MARTDVGAWLRRVRRIRETEAQARDGDDRRRRGFSLIEVLLSLVLLGLFLSALVWNFTNFGRGNDFEEGARRVETLLRFARGEASRLGRRVRLEFKPRHEPGLEGTLESAAAPLGDEATLASIVFTIERDPLLTPGVFTSPTGDSWMTSDVNQLVGVESVSELDRVTGVDVLGTAVDGDLDAVPGEGELLEYGEAGVSPEAGVTLENAATDQARRGFVAAEEGDLESLLGPVTFYPDGSSDSVRLTLAPLEPNARRRVTFELAGVTGSIRRIDHAVSEDEDGALEPEESATSERDESSYEPQTQRQDPNDGRVAPSVREPNVSQPTGPPRRGRRDGALRDRAGGGARGLEARP